MCITYFLNFQGTVLVPEHIPIVKANQLIFSLTFNLNTIFWKSHSHNTWYIKVLKYIYQNISVTHIPFGINLTDYECIVTIYERFSEIEFYFGKERW